MDFKLSATDSKTKARSGVLNTDHGEIKTPIFMPVGTAGSVKAVHHRELVDDITAQIILGNTFHLMLRPGVEVIAKHGLAPLKRYGQHFLTDPRLIARIAIIMR